MNISPLTIRRLRNFRANKRGYYSALIFSVLFLISIFAEFIANDKPIFVVFDSQIHFPVFEKISETYYGGEFETEADYKDPFVNEICEFYDCIAASRKPKTSLQDSLEDLELFQKIIETLKKSESV